MWIAAACSHSNARRGLLTLGCGLLVELATRLFLPQQIIRFGILHFLGCAALLWALAAPLLDRLPAPALLAGSLALFLLTYALPWGGLGFGPLRLVTLPSGLYASPWLFWLGLPAPDFILPIISRCCRGYFCLSPAPPSAGCWPPGRRLRAPRARGCPCSARWAATRCWFT